MEETTPDMLGIAKSLQMHGRPSQIAFLLFELLTAADYTDEEILTVAHELEELVS